MPETGGFAMHCKWRVGKKSPKCEQTFANVKWQDVASTYRLIKPTPQVQSQLKNRHSSITLLMRDIDASDRGQLTSPKLQHPNQVSVLFYWTTG